MLNRIITDADFFECEPGLLTNVDRTSARGVLTDGQNRVAMLYMRKERFYKLTCGVVLGDEPPELAYARGVKDDTGYDCEILCKIGTIQEHKLRNNFCQLSHCYLARAVGPGAREKIAQREKEQGYVLRWVPVGDAVSIIEHSLQACNDYMIRFMLLRDSIIVKYAYRKLLLRD